mgnify:CR=1 FL=1
MQEKIIDLINESIRNFSNISNDEHMISLIEQISDIIITAFDNENKLLLCGNGGSAADAQHIAAELSGRFEIDRKALNAQALHVNSSYLTAVANDYGFEDVYSRMIEASAKSGDVLIALSTSGNSKNVINAIKKANIIMGSQGRILVRKSGTESKIRVMGESNNKILLSRCVNMISKKIK